MFYLGGALLMFYLTIPPVYSFREARDSSDTSLQECRTNAAEGRKFLGSGSYGGDSDLDYHSDDILVHCRKPIQLSQKVSIVDINLSNHLSEESKRIAQDLSQRSAFRNQTFVVHAYHKSSEVSYKVASAIKSQLVTMKLQTLEHEPRPFMFLKARVDSGLLKRRCQAGEFNHDNGITRIFVFKSDMATINLRVAICQGQTWEQI